MQFLDTAGVRKIKQYMVDTTSVTDQSDASPNIKQLVQNEDKIYPLVRAEGVKYADGSILSEKNFLTEHQSLADLFASATYNSTSKKIEFYNKANTKVGEIDASDFIKDGMVSSVNISGGNLNITFNEDSGKETISIPISGIFNADNYYTKTESDDTFVSISDYVKDEEVIAAALNDLNTRVLNNATAIPTKTSDLTNDSGFLNEYDEEVIAAALNDLNTRVNTLNVKVTAKQDTLTFDSTPTSGSTNPVTSGGVYTAIQSASVATDSTPTSGSTNPITSGGVYTALQGKQNTLTFDSAPTSGSTNPVTSGGVYTALQSAGNVDEVTFNGTAATVTNKTAALTLTATDSGSGNVVTGVSISGNAITVTKGNVDISSKEDVSNKVTSLSAASTDDQYPSAKCVYDQIGDIESALDTIIGGNTGLSTVVHSTTIRTIVSISQTDYDALETKDSSTLYVVV